MRNRFMAWIAASFLILVASYSLAQADCTSDYQNAMSLLKNTQQKISHKAHPKLTPFRENFGKSITSLKAGHCDAELDLISDYVLSEQKKYPTAMPIED